MDIATLLGMVCGFALVAAAVLLGGSAATFVDMPAMLIVFGGTFCITVMCYSMGDVLRAPGALLSTLRRHEADPQDAALRVLDLAERSRRDGVLALQNVQGQLVSEPFLHKAIGLVIDGTAPDEMEKILRGEVVSVAQRHRQAAGVFRKAAEVAPAMGLIGTLVGLIQMLGRLDDPSTIGPSMAVALLTTFYGALLANMVFAPLASKLERNAEDEILVRNLYLMGAGSIGRRENPRRLEMLINTLLPPAKQVAYFD